MGQFLLLLSAALVVGAIVFGVAVLISGDDPGLVVEEPEGRAVPLPSARPLVEDDIGGLRFDTALRGYRMSQVDAALRRAAYDLGFKEELIGVLEAEVIALRDGRLADADVLRTSRLAALGGAGLDGAGLGGAGLGGAAFPEAEDGDDLADDLADELDADLDGDALGPGDAPSGTDRTTTERTRTERTRTERTTTGRTSTEEPAGSDPLRSAPSAASPDAEPSERTTGVW